jgi:cytochrome P450
MTVTAESKSHRLVPGPKGKWLIGDMIEYDRDRLAWLERTKAEFGDVVSLAPGVVLMHHPQTAHEVLEQTNKTVILHNPLVDDHGAHIDRDDRMAHWRAIRRDTLRGLHPTLLAEHLIRISTALRTGVAEAADNECDVFDFAQRLCGKAVADFCVGAEGDTDAVVDGVEAMFLSTMEVAERRESRFRWAPRPAIRRAAALNDNLFATLLALVKTRIAQARPVQPRDLLDVLISESGPGADHHLAGVLRITLVASHGSPGSALAWTLLQLSEHPGTASKIKAELAALPYDPLDPTQEGHRLPIDDLPYTIAVIKETLRLYPPAWLLARRVIETVDLGGYRLPTGSQVYVSPYVIHRDERWWNHPDQFQPERWLARRPPHVRHGYLPFGSGPRYCAGGHLGLVQAALLVAEFAAHYQISLPPASEVTPRCRSILLPDGLRGCWRRI